MNEIIIVKKELGMTSHDVVNKVRRIFKTKKVGHLGTLDPLATGVLVVCINDATKLVQFLENHSKTYIAKVCLGKSTDTYDLEGKIVDEKAINNISCEQIDKILLKLTGKICQLPPKFSAIKVNGKKLYEYARNNLEVKIEPRSIEIFSLARISDIEYKDNCAYFDIETTVSKGTYIRSLCYDIGQMLGVPSVMASLVRTKSGIFDIKDASTLDMIEKGNYRSFTMCEALSDFDFLDSDEACKKAISGMKISCSYVKEILGNIPEKIAIKSIDKLVAIYEFDRVNNCYKAARVWN